MKPHPPGLLRAGVDPDVVMMIGMAGHVDHGKTSLVRLLTGCNTDRLKAEQERGMTIDLGFAPCTLGGAYCVGIVDVPGHEKFIRNMVAGVSGIDLAVLVIAADDGIMPQTIEHFQIMDLLGVRYGIVALTKIDLVTPDRVDEVTRQIRTFFQGTFMADALICPLSSETGEGVFEFYDALVARVKSAAGRVGSRLRGLVRQPRRGVFRMPIERTFPQKGFGTVVTGTPLDGAIRVGEEVELVPGGQVGRVRGIQRFLREATEGSHGQCLAINVPELGREPPVRGQVLCQPGFLKAGVCFGVHLRTVPGLAPPLANAETVKFHTGTDEKTAKLYLLETRLLPPGQTGFAVVVLAHPVAAAVHDRFIIRRPSPAATVAGGGILAALPDAHHFRKKHVLDALKERHALFSDVDLASLEGIDREIAYLLRTQYPVGASLRELACAALLPDGVALESLSRLSGVLALQPEYFISEEVYCARRAEVEARIREAAEKESLSLRLSDLRKGFEAWPAPLWNAIRRDLESGQQVGIRGDRLVLHEAVAKLNEADRTLMAALLQIYENTAFHSPRPDELPALVHAPQERVNRLLDLLCSDGKLVRVAKSVVLSYNVFKRAQDMVVRTIQERGVLDSADFKHSIQSSRKYALAILDCLDTRRVTVRSGNDRRLAADYQRNLVT